MITKEELANEYVTRNGNQSTCMIGKAEYEAFLAGLNEQEGIDNVKAHDLKETH